MPIHSLRSRTADCKTESLQQVLAGFRRRKCKQLPLAVWRIIVFQVFQQAPHQNVSVPLALDRFRIFDGNATEVKAPAAAGMLRSQYVVRSYLVLDYSSTQKGINKAGAERQDIKVAQNLVGLVEETN